MKPFLMLLAWLAVTWPGLAGDAGSPPKGATVLFDGKSTGHWVYRDSNKPCRWIVQDGYMQVKAGDIATKEKFTDFQLHVEFWLPKYPDNVKSQARANSGVFLQGRYEIQVLDSYNNPTYKAGGCAALYGQKEPDDFEKAVKPPETWNTYDITFRASRFDPSGNLKEKARVTVVWNDVKVHDNVEINGPTFSLDGGVHGPGPICLQDHGCPIRFRNIWIVPAK